MDDWLSGAISGGAGLIGSAVNYFSQQSANETNLQLARENRDFYYQQWQRENQYNDPSAVMQRLSRAGLNPNLMYGEGTGGLAASATMQNVDPGRVAAPTVDPYTMAQIGLLNAQTEKTKSETKQSTELHPLNIQNLQANNDVLAQRLKNLNAEEQLTYAEISYKAVLSDVTEKNATTQRELWNSQKGLNESEKLKTDEEYRQVVALFALKRQGMDLENQALLAKIGVDQSERSRILKVVSLMEREMAVKEKMAESGYQDMITNRGAHNLNVTRYNALAPYEIGVKQQQINVQAAQARYWDDFTRRPHKYRSTSVRIGPVSASN